MPKKALLILMALICGSLVASCDSDHRTPTPIADMPNPASVYCEEQGGTLEIRTDADGGQYGACLFPDGSECEEWAFYRGECEPGTQEAVLPNPASVYCEEQGGALEIRTDADGGQYGACLFPDGSECDEWGFFRGECSPGGQNSETIIIDPSDLPTPLPIDPADYQGWWVYTSTNYGFSIQLPPDWVVEEATASDPLMNNHLLNLHPENTGENLNLRMTFRRVGEEFLIWPTGVGAGEFIPQGVLDVAGQPVRRMSFICPTGQVNSIWYQGEEEANIKRDDLEFGFIFSYTGIYCEGDYSLSGKVQRVGEMIIASLQLP